jgi:predicted unusual protein kinase regulating ubiquinone biosynthesis (AarF/ABC1/UbiB family)
MIRTGSICMSLLLNHIKNETKKDTSTSTNTEFKDKANKLSTIATTFSNYGGVLTKLAQIISYGGGDYNNDVFSDCKPKNSKETIKYLSNILLKKNDVLEFDSTVYKSGSIGQVHKGKIFDGDKEVVFKVQYVGLKDECKSDLFLLDKLLKFVYNGNNISNAIIDIKEKIDDEMDYNLEIENHTTFYNLWNQSSIVSIPKVYKDYCFENIICIEFVEGELLSDYLGKSTLESRYNIGLKLVEFVFTGIFKHQLFYSDIHYGNFLITDKDELYVFDFGCIHKIDDILHSNLKNLFQSLYYEDEELFYSTVVKMDIMDEDNISSESRNYMYQYFQEQLEPFICDRVFEFTEEWLDRVTEKNIELMREWNLPKNIVYINKIFYGLIHILTKLNLTANLLHIFKKIQLI